MKFSKSLQFKFTLITLLSGFKTTPFLAYSLLNGTISNCNFPNPKRPKL